VKKNKIIITSTPVGMRFTWDIWMKEYYLIQERKKRKEKLEQIDRNLKNE